MFDNELLDVVMVIGAVILMALIISVPLIILYVIIHLLTGWTL